MRPLIPFSGIQEDIRKRAPYYKDDWRQGRMTSYNILAPATYIFFATVLPAITFGDQLAEETDDAFGVAHVLASTAIAGTLQSVIGGQPLLIVGVAEPLVLLYKFAYEFLEKREEEKIFRPFVSWSLVWAALMHLLLAVTNACKLIDQFTRFAGETFGALIALLFLQQSIEGVKGQFSPEQGLSKPLALVNGLFAVILASLQVALAALLTRARSWPFFKRKARNLLADYGPPLAVVAVTGISYSLSSSNIVPSEVPVRVDAKQIYGNRVTENFTVVSEMGEVGGAYIAAAIVPGIIITVLIFFDHNVASQLAQQSDFGLRKPSAYHLDFLLEAILLLAFALLGLPPTNGVLPQAPLHTKSLLGIKQTSIKSNAKTLFRRMKERRNSHANPQSRAHASPESAPSPSARSPDGEVDTEAGEGSGYAEETRPNEATELYVREQRVSNLTQSLLVAICLFLGPVLSLIPKAVLFGYFAFMAIESLPGNQLWSRFLLFFTDGRFWRGKRQETVPEYIDKVPRRVVLQFTAIQLACLAAVYGLTFGGVAGVAFPILIILLIPLRQYVLPLVFKKEHLEPLDRLEDVEDYVEEEAEEEAEDPHNYMSGQELGGYGAFGQVVRHSIDATVSS